MRAVAYNPIRADPIIYTSVSGLISLQSVCLAMLCLSEKPDPRHPSRAREEIEQITPCCPSVRQDRAELGIVRCVLEGSRWCWVTSAVWLQRLAVYLKSWRQSYNHSNENQTTMFVTDVIFCQTIDGKRLNSEEVVSVSLSFFFSLSLFINTLLCYFIQNPLCFSAIFLLGNIRWSFISSLTFTE